MKIVKIYALFSLDKPNEIRYVGQTCSQIEKYFKNAYQNDILKFRNSKRPVYKWLFSNNLKVGYKILEESAIWNESEIKWIAKLKEEGHRLLNCTNGGEGLIGYIFTDDHRENIRKSRICKKHSKSARLNISKAQIGKKLSESHKSSLLKSLIGRKLSEETIRKMSKSQIGKKHSDETKKKLSIKASQQIRKPLTTQHKLNISLAKKGKKIKLVKRLFKELYE